MTTTTQQIPSNPAQRLADKILVRTNNGRDLIDLIHDIAQGEHDASNSDRITASNFLFERGFGKCPKQSPATGDGGQTSDPATATATDNTPHNPRLVTQAKDALQDSLGPAPSATQQTPLSTNRYPPQTIIQDYILEITNEGETLVDSLMEIAYPRHDDPTVTPRLRSRASRILADRGMGTDPAALRNAVCPDCRRKWTAHPGHSPNQAQVEEEPYNKEVWDDIIVKLKALEAKHNLDPNRHIPRLDHSAYMPPDDFDFTPHLEEADQFTAEIELRAERRKKWPEFEEYRRKKLAQTYPSHSEDGKSPDT